MKNIKTKRSLSVLLALIMILTALPLTAVTSTAYYISDEFISSDGLWWCEVVCDENGNPDGTVIIANPAGEDYAYLGNEKNVVIPTVIDGYKVADVGYFAFGGLDFIESIFIPSTIEEFSSSLLYNNYSLKEINVDPDNEYLSSVDGVLYSKDGKELIVYPMGKTDESFVVPEGVETIGNDAFLYCENLREITLPDTLISIKFGAFDGCRGLTEIDIPDSVKSLGSLVFYGSGLSSCNIGKGLKETEGNPFGNCYSLESVYVDPENECFLSEDDILFNKDKSLLVSYPSGKSGDSYTIPDSVTAVGQDAFSGCYLNEIVISENVSDIGWGAFDGCYRLNTVIFNGQINEIEGYAFYNCSLLSVVLPSGLTSLGSEAFSCCDNLENVIIPESVSDFGDNVFSGCDKLTVYGYTGSAAEAYANENSISFIDINSVDHIWSSPSYDWSEDYSEVTALVSCLKHSDEIITETVKTKSEVIETVPCQWSYVNLTADFTNEKFSQQTKMVYIDGEHDWGESTYEWNFDYSSVYAERICKTNSSHSEWENVETTRQVIKQATTKETGRVIYTADFENEAFVTQSKEVETPKIPERIDLSEGESYSLSYYFVGSDSEYGQIYFTPNKSGDYMFVSRQQVGAAITLYDSNDKIIATESSETDYMDYGFTKTLKAGETYRISVKYNKSSYIYVQLIEETPSPDPEPIYFPDVKESNWFYTPVEYCAEKGYIKGYSNGKFGPADSLTRQDFVIILARIAGANLKNYKSCKLKDVDMKAYYGPAVAWATSEHIINGYADGRFGVGDPITREQVAVILYGYLGRPDKGSESTIAGFADNGKISSFAKDAMVWAVNNGVITGKDAKTLAPTATASRAEIATIITRMDQKGMFGA